MNKLNLSQLLFSVLHLPGELPQHMGHDPYLFICILFIVEERDHHLGDLRESLDFILLFLSCRSCILFFVGTCEFVLCVSVPAMGNSNSFPQCSPLRYIFQNWNTFNCKQMKCKKMIFLCNTAWLQYYPDSGKEWPINGSIIYASIRQSELFYNREGK